MSGRLFLVALVVASPTLSTYLILLTKRGSTKKSLSNFLLQCWLEDEVQSGHKGGFLTYTRLTKKSQQYPIGVRPENPQNFWIGYCLFNSFSGQLVQGVNSHTESLQALCWHVSFQDVHWWLDNELKNAWTWSPFLPPWVQWLRWQHQPLYSVQSSLANCLRGPWGRRPFHI